jgi:predicted esterase YcpF (UPF0227 family)
MNTSAQYLEDNHIHILKLTAADHKNLPEQFTIIEQSHPEGTRIPDYFNRIDSLAAAYKINC